MNKNFGALWLKTAGNGKKFMAGVMNFVCSKCQTPEAKKIVIFKNEKKEKETSPDYNVLPSLTVEERAAEQAAQAVGGEVV